MPGAGHFFGDLGVGFDRACGPLLGAHDGPYTGGVGGGGRGLGLRRLEDPAVFGCREVGGVRDSGAAVVDGAASEGRDGSDSREIKTGVGDLDPGTLGVDAEVEYAMSGAEEVDVVCSEEDLVDCSPVYGGEGLGSSVGVAVCDSSSNAASNSTSSAASKSFSNPLPIPSVSPSPNKLSLSSVSIHIC